MDTFEDLIKSQEEKEEPKPKKRKQKEEQEKCSICLQNMNSSGLHQICCLSCGHLYGKNCIEKWLKEKKYCPKCLQPSFLNQIRLLYFENLEIVDNSQIEDLRELYEKEKKKRMELEVEIAKYKKEEIPKESFVLKKVIETKNSRVMDFHKEGSKLYISFDTNYKTGVDIIGIEQKFLDNFEIYEKPIRDIKCCPFNQDVLLTIAGNEFKLVDSMSKKILIHSKISDGDLFSCCFDLKDANNIFLGSNGFLNIFDLRNYKYPTSKIKTNYVNPLHSLSYIDNNEIQGIFASSLSGSFFFDENNDYLSNLLISGNCSSSSYDPTSGLFLSTFRSNPSSKANHKIFKLNNDLSINHIRTIDGFFNRKILSKSFISQNPFNSSQNLVYSYSEGSNKVLIWNLNDSSIYQTINTNLNDIYQIYNVNTHLFLLSKDKLNYYKLLKF